MRLMKPGILMLTIVTLGMIPGTSAQTKVGHTSYGQAKKIGTAVLGAGPHTDFISQLQLRTDQGTDLVAARRNAAARKAPSSAPLSVPSPRLNSIKPPKNVFGFPGLTTVDTANTNGFVLSPPDQGLCVGNGFVLETINLVTTVYSNTGTELTAPEALNAFFGADPTITQLSDPRCYFDKETQRWFMSITNVINFNNDRSNLYLAVSQTSDPRGAFTIYSIDTTDDGLDGTPSNAACPCFGDQPTLGADAFGIYLTTNEFPLFSAGFNGAQIYALSKWQLVAGDPTTLVHIGGLPLAEGEAYSVQPASSPDLGDERWPGVEYFLSSLDFQGTLDNRIAVWALSNTSSLLSATPHVWLTNDVITSEVYGQPPLATQKTGPYPLGQSLGDPEEMINTDDDRMQQVTYANGHLWGALNTVVWDGTQINAGIAYFDVNPKISGGQVRGKVQGQSYVAVKNASVFYPAVGVTEDGTAAAAFTLSGAAYYPSAAYAHLTPAHAVDVEIVAAGQAPADDFSGYPQFGGSGAVRWGDYSWAVADGDSLWLATEYIPGTINSLDYFTNFGTFIYKVDLQ